MSEKVVKMTPKIAIPKSFGKDDSLLKKITLCSISSETLNPSNGICMILDEDGPFSVCAKLFDGNSEQPPKPLPREAVYLISNTFHITDYQSSS